MQTGQWYQLLLGGHFPLGQTCLLLHTQGTLKIWEKLRDLLTLHTQDLLQNSVQ